MQTYVDKLQELGVQSLEENKDKIKAAMVESQLELIKKAPQLMERLLDSIGDMLISGNTQDE
jgi:TRAP-type C4-dicarboxylate transport system substrate-binding protein